MNSARVALTFAVVVSACGAPQTPVTFVTSAKGDTALDTVSRTLAAEGQTPVNVDRELGIVQTEWKDTGFLYGQVQGVNATIVRRYTVTLTPAPAGANITVRVDAKRCPQGGYTIGGTEIRGTCEEAGAIPGKMQTELDTLATKIRGALGVTLAGGPSCAIGMGRDCPSRDAPLPSCG
jgi:hypothetical protein